MIITWLTGGLGNQMFQYAAGLALARHCQTELKLDASWFEDSPDRKPHERYGLSAFNITESFATPEEIRRTRGIRPRRLVRLAAALSRMLQFKSIPEQNAAGNWHAPPTFAYYPGFLDQPDNTYLHGMFQSERFFTPVSELVRTRFTLRSPAPPAIDAIAERIKRGPSAFVHFRRGDYVRDPRYAREIGALGRSYYERAIDSFRRRHPGTMLYVFSDDIDAVAREFTPPGPHEFVREPSGTAAHDVLRLMSLCDHAIIANSTLGWWGAWLAEKPGQIVIAPGRWFADVALRDSRDILPDRWERCDG